MQLHQGLQGVLICWAKSNKESLDKSFPSWKLPGLLSVLEPNESLSFHVERGHSNSQVYGCLVVIKKLIYLIRPSCSIVPLEPRKVKPQRLGVEQLVF